MSTYHAKGNINTAYTDMSSADKPEEWFYGQPKVRRLFSRRVQHCSIYTQITCHDKNTGTTELPVFEFSNTADYARSSWVQAQTPKVTVKAEEQKKYRIAYTWNPAHHIFNAGVLRFNDLPVSEFDTHSLDFISQYRVSAAKWALYQKMIGNVPELQEWTHELPSYPIKLPTPHSYAQDATSALPLYRATLNRIKEEYTVQTELSRLIRLQINKAADVELDEPDWQDAKAGEVDLSSILTVEGGRRLEISDVSHWTKYVIIHDDEREATINDVYEQVIEQVHGTSSKKAGPGEHLKEFRLSGPTKALFFGMANKTSDLYNNRSNYTDDRRAGEVGSDPVARASLIYDTSARFENVPGHWFDFETWLHGERSISEAGMHALFYGQHVNSLDLDGSSNFSHIVSSLKVDVEEKTAQENEYALVIRALSAHRLTFKQDGAGFLAF